MIFCEHNSYSPEQKTFFIKETINVLNGIATCSKCNAIIDITPLRDGGQLLKRINE